MVYGILSIAGTDANGSAGLLLDNLVIQDLKMCAFGVVTAVTAQDKDQVYCVVSVDEDLFNDQLCSVLSNNKISGVKIGLIPNNKIVKLIANFLKELRENPETKNIPVVWDPVGSASAPNGECLTKVDFKKACKKLLPYVTVVTPNLVEASKISGIEVNASGSENYLKTLKEMAKFFKKSGAKNVIIKGGHLLDYSAQMGRERYTWGVLDYLETKDSKEPFYFIHKRIGQKSPCKVHGTGCAFSSALCTFLSYGYNVEDALTQTKAYITRAITDAIGTEGYKYIRMQVMQNIQFQDYPLMGRSKYIFPAAEFNRDDDGFDKLIRPLGFYVIADSSAWIERLCKAGVKTMQLRIKKPKSQEFLEEEIIKSIEIAKKYDVQLFINDYWELAIKHKAYGVHLGQDDIDYENLLAIKIAGLRLGISTHGYAEIARAMLIKPSYIALGHIFPTQTKEMPSNPQGTGRLARYVKLLENNFELVAIGGIKLNNVESVLGTGIKSVAVITAITKDPEPEAAIKEWQYALTNGRLSENAANALLQTEVKPE